MDNAKKYVIIIDSFRSHNAMAFRCFEKHLIPIHVFSSKDSFQENFGSVANYYFTKSFIFENVQQLEQDLIEYKNNILFVFSCTDTGQRIKDILDNLFNLSRRNDNYFAKERYNKFNLYQLLGQDSSLNNFNNFVDIHNECIIKPSPISMSGGCLDVSFVDRNSSVIDQKENFFISKYFSGDEYAVDIVSYEGKHKLVSVWKYIRNDVEKVWKDKVELVRYEDQTDLINKIYVISCSWLNKINHQYGPVHLELKHNSNKFFCIEINFRLNGHLYYGTVAKRLGNNQIDLTIDCYTFGHKFNNDLIYYKSTGYITKLYLTNEKENIQFKNIKWENLNNNLSVDWIFKHGWPWDNLPISKKTYQSSSAILTMSNTSKEILLDHEEKVKDIFYQRFQETVQ